jgi:hypothetical protein
MQISSLRPGEVRRKLTFTVDQTSKLNNNILRVTLSDRSGKINWIVDGYNLVRKYKLLNPGATISLQNFVVTAKVDEIRKYFPKLQDPVQFVAHDTSKREYIYLKEKVHVATIIEADLAEPRRNSGIPERLIGPNDEHVVDFQYAISGISATSPILEISAFATVLNVSGYYKTQNEEYVQTIRLTDPTIHPAKIT